MQEQWTLGSSSVLVLEHKGISISLNKHFSFAQTFCRQNRHTQKQSPIAKPKEETETPPARELPCLLAKRRTTGLMGQGTVTNTYLLGNGFLFWSSFKESR